MKLRPYQTEMINQLRPEVYRNKSVMIQLPTGGGKTAIISSVVSALSINNYSCWFVVPRNELLKQASEHFHKWKITHGLISAKTQESRAYKVHVVSKDTLIRRYGKIKNWPDFLFFDEAHLYLDRQIEIASHLPETSKVIGCTATPERLDGRGLSELYQSIIYGPSLGDMVEMGFLSSIKYFCPPIEGLENLHRKGTEYNADEVDELLKKRQIYGKALEHYKEYADSKPCLVFCRSVKSSIETAEKFCAAGYKFENIDGTMSYSKRKALIEAVKDGRLHGLTSCELVTYGLDLPRLECIIMLRPTLSKSLFYQMVGRGLRPYPGKETCIVLDHVSNLKQHGHPLTPYEWKFTGKEKTKKEKGESVDTAKLCPKCFMYFTGTVCDNCGEKKETTPRPNMEVIDGRLVEALAPIKLKDRPWSERKEFIDKINGIVNDFHDQSNEMQIAAGPIGDLMKIAKSLGNSIMWVYWKLSENVDYVNVSLLHEIARQEGYKSGWVYYKEKEIARKLDEKRLVS
jgi:superfamily II DNA or RNA helicase